MTLQEKQEAMRRKYHARRNKRLTKQLTDGKAKAQAAMKVEAKVAPKINRTRVQGDLPAATIDRMELILYRIAKRKACIRVPRFAPFPVTHLQQK
jgi:hypothetical protein